VLKELKKSYYHALAPAALAFLTASLMGYFQIHLLDPLTWVTGPILFTLSVLFAVALPIFMRTLFAHRMRDRKATTKEDFLHFERRQIQLSLVSPYWAALAILLQSPQFYLVGSFLMALYGSYYYYPSERRIRFDERIFRVRDLH
jgi:hypothetical protein